MTICKINILSKVKKNGKDAFYLCNTLQKIEISEKAELESLPLSVFEKRQSLVIIKKIVKKKHTNIHITVLCIMTKNFSFKNKTFFFEHMKIQKTVFLVKGKSNISHKNTYS